MCNKQGHNQSQFMTYFQYHIIFLFVKLMLWVSVGQAQPQNHFELRGIFNGGDSGTVEMRSLDGDSNLAVTQLNKGSFIFKGNLDEGDRFLFNIMPGNWSFRAIVEPGYNSVVVDTSGAQHYFHPKTYAHTGLIFFVEQSGSHFYEVERARDEAAGLEKLKETLANGRKLLVENSLPTDSVDLLNNMLDSAEKSFYYRQEVFIYEYIQNYPQDLVGPFLLNQYLRSRNPQSLSQLQKTFNAIESPATQSKHYAALQQRVEELLAIKPGSIAPDFTAPDSLGNLAGMVNYKNKYLLIDFWASWCGPCRKAIPMWKELYKQYQPQGFEIVAISTDTDRDDWLKALRIEKMPWRQLHEPQPKGNNASISDIFRVHALPTYVLVDEEGKIVMISGDSELVRDSINDRFKKRE